MRRSPHVFFVSKIPNTAQVCCLKSKESTSPCYVLRLGRTNQSKKKWFQLRHGLSCCDRTRKSCNIRTQRTTRDGVSSGLSPKSLSCCFHVDWKIVKLSLRSHKMCMDFCASIKAFAIRLLWYFTPHYIFLCFYQKYTANGSLDCFRARKLKRKKKVCRGMSTSGSLVWAFQKPNQVPQ
jgi:hypothetical protein